MNSWPLTAERSGFLERARGETETEEGLGNSGGSFDISYRSWSVNSETAFGGDWRLGIKMANCQADVVETGKLLEVPKV